MNKKGFTLMEIIVVIALLGAIMLLVVPNITKNFKDSKKRLFYDNVVSLYTSAGRSFLLLDNPSNKTFSNSGNALDVDVSDDITYKIVVNSYGEVTSIYVTNGTYSYSKSNNNGIKKKDIKLDDIFEGTGDEDASAKVTLFDKLLEDNPTISERTNFSTPFTTNTANTLYKATENGTDVYYFTGKDTESTPINNWVKFGKYKSDLIKYRGFKDATTTWNFREYFTMEECTSASRYNYNCTAHKYASAGDDIYWRIIRTNADGSIRLLFSGTSVNTIDGYIGKSAFNTSYKSPKYVGYMYGDSDTTLEEARTNTNDSTIKTYIDNWYENNLTSYTNYLSNDAVYCNDRELRSGDTYSTSSSFEFKPTERLITNKAPSYDCTNSKDAFSGNNIEAKLKYPIALMTADEIVYAGGKGSLTAPMWYYTNSAYNSITDSTFWFPLSSQDWDGSDSFVWFVGGSSSPGALYGVTVYDVNAVRPVVSLKSCTLYKSGNGSASSPYEIEMNGGC